MIRLNDINLLSISLRGISLSRISLGGSSGGGVPPVPPLRPIASYRTAGKTNQDADRDVLKDLTGNGHDIVLKNFSYSLGSGYGLYKIDWSSKDWSNHLNGTRAEGTFTSSKIHITKVKISNANFFENVTISPALKYKVKVSGLKDNEILSYVYYSSTKPTVFRIQQDGVYDLPSSTYETKYQMGWRLVFSGESVDVDITIEQIPEYEGALVFDGVDDYGICEDFPVLTKESGYSIVMLRQYITTTENFYIASDGITIPDTSFIFECAATTETRNFGTSTKNLTIPHSLSIQTSEQYNGQKLNKGSNTKGSGILQVGRFVNKYCKHAIWEIQIYDRPLTEEEIQNITDVYKKKYPQLFIDEV